MLRLISRDSFIIVHPISRLSSVLTRKKFPQIAIFRSAPRSADSGHGFRYSQSDPVFGVASDRASTGSCLGQIAGAASSARVLESAGNEEPAERS
jgi:hypothetical protein